MAAKWGTMCCQSVCVAAIEHRNHTQLVVVAWFLHTNWSEQLRVAGSLAAGVALIGLFETDVTRLLAFKPPSRGGSWRPGRMPV